MKNLAPLILTAALLTGCASPNTPTRSPSLLPTAPAPVPARAAATVTAPGIVTPRPPVELRFVYPPDWNLFSWTLQSSTNLTTWRDVPANVDSNGWVNITNTRPAEFYRMKGTR